MVNIYILYIRSVLEQSCQVWNYSITEEEKEDIERVQKVACRIILKDLYIDYNHALEYLGLDSLSERRAALCLKFAKNCLLHEQTQDMFPLNQNDEDVRDKEKFHVQHAKGGRLFDSSIPQLQRALNADARKKK